MMPFQLYIASAYDSRYTVYILRLLISYLNKVKKNTRMKFIGLLSRTLQLWCRGPYRYLRHEKFPLKQKSIHIAPCRPRPLRWK